MTDKDTSYEIVFPSGADSGYAREKLGGAVEKLATGLNGIKTRLADAYIELAILTAADFPPELVDEWKQIKSDLTSGKGKMQYYPSVIDNEIVELPVGRLFLTLRYMRREKAKDIAQRICSLEARLSYLEDSSELP